MPKNRPQKYRIYSILKDFLTFRWEPYTPVGDQIVGTRFISFKVPLTQKICRVVAEEFRFTPDDLVKKVKEKGNELGLVIDLTNTDRYYPANALFELGVTHEKIKTEGLFVPSAEVMSRFTSVVDTFLQQNKDNNKLIGVHCTHGVNRTGYIVCRYMIDHLNCKPQDAIDAFNQARGHSIERENYLCALNGGTPEEIARLEKKLLVEREKEREQEQRTRYQLKSESDWRGQGRRGGYQQYGNYERRFNNYGGRREQYDSRNDGYRGNSDGYRGNSDGYRGNSDGYRGNSRHPGRYGYDTNRGGPYDRNHSNQHGGNYGYQGGYDRNYGNQSGDNGSYQEGGRDPYDYGRRNFRNNRGRGRGSNHGYSNYGNQGYHSNQTPSNNDYQIDHSSGFRNRNCANDSNQGSVFQNGDSIGQSRPRVFETVVDSYQTSSQSLGQDFKPGTYDVTQLESNFKAESGSHRSREHCESYGENKRGRLRTLSGGSGRCTNVQQRNRKVSDSHQSWPGQPGQFEDYRDRSGDFN